jgi:hypothetical protein
MSVCPLMLGSSLVCSCAGISRQQHGKMWRHTAVDSAADSRSGSCGTEFVGYAVICR